jgi:hypothetical protein
MRIAQIARLLALALLLPAATLAQESPPASVHWAYSAYFGTGWYRVSADRDVFVVRMTPRWSFSEPSLDEEGNRSVGLYFKTPVSVGLDRFDYDDVLGAVDVDNVSFLSVNPGIDIEIPINDIWSLRPYASVGHGWAFDGSDSAWTYWAGIKSQVRFNSGKLNWRLLNQAGFVGYTPNEGPDDTIWPLMAGLEFDYPVGAPTPDGDQLLLHWRAAYTVFGNDLEFTGDPAQDTAISDQWEIGAAIARRDSRIPIWFLKFDMLGLGYRASSNGELKGITFLFRSMFDL